MNPKQRIRERLRNFTSDVTVSGATGTSGTFRITNPRRIHREEGPAVYYEDGCVAYYWRGVHVPSYVVLEPQKITLTKIFRQKNTEMRRAMIDRYGRGRFLKDMGAKLEHTDSFGILWEFDSDFALSYKEFSPKVDEIRRILNGRNKVKYLQIKDSSTEREYFLEVPSTMKRAKQAVAWTFAMKEEEYSPITET